MNLNKILLIGRVAKDPELKTLPSGQSVVKFSMATNDKYKNNEGKIVEDTEFHDCVAFGKLAETISQFVVKGQEIYVEGKKKTREWKDKEEKQHRMVSIVIGTIQFGSRPAGKREDKAPAEIAPESSEELQTGDIPF